MGTLNDWSTTAASNASADATINWAEGQLAPTLNNSARGMMARLKAWAQQQAGLATTGSSNAYVYTSPSGHAFASLVTNSRITFKANHTNSGAATLAVDGLTATAIRKTNGATALAAGDLVSGQIYDVVYDGTYWVLLGVGAGGFQPLDADLTAIAALGYTSGDYLIKKTAADTWALIAITTAGAALLDDANAAAQLTTLGVSAFVQTVLDDADASAVRTTIGLGTMATQASSSYLPVAGGTLTGTLLHSSTQPDVRLQETDAGTNEKYWWNYALGGALYFATVNDAFASATTYLTISRSGQAPVAATFAAIDVVLASAVAPTSIYSAGYRGTPIVSGNSAYAFPLVDAGSTIYHDEAGTRTWTIPANASVAHPIGTCFVLDNTGNAGAAGAITLAITTDTLRRGDGTAGTGSRTIGASQVATIRKVKSTEWVITGAFT